MQLFNFKLNSLVNAIKINCSGCGQKKTTEYLFPLVKQLYIKDILMLIVVPSYELQKVYKQLKVPIHLITHYEGDSQSVTGKLIYALTKKLPVIVITQEAFIKTQIPRKYMQDRVLILDEAITPYESHTLTLTDSKNRNYFKFEGIFKFADDHITYNEKQSPQPWHELILNTCTEYPSLLSSSNQWRTISNSNMKLYATYTSGDALINNTSNTAQLITELDPSVLDGWLDVHIASAAFEFTFMYYWMINNNIPMTITHPFVPHKSYIRIHRPIYDIKFSKELKKDQPELVPDVMKFADKNKNGDLIYVSNNNEKEIMGDNIRINHNAHGINAYADFGNYAHFSALLPNKLMLDFFMNKVGMKYKEVIMAFNGYLAYQLMFRTRLRKEGAPCTDVFVIDSDVADMLPLFFDKNYCTELRDIPVMDIRTYNKIKDQLSPEMYEKYKDQIEKEEELKKIAMTRAERQKAYYDRKTIDKPKKEQKLKISRAESQKAYRERKKLMLKNQH